MADLNDPLKESYISKVGDALKPYVDELKGKGFDATDRIAQLTGAGGQIEDAGKARKTAEQAVTEAVKAEQKLRNNFYTLATGTVSLVEGVLGKTHALPVKLRSLRMDLIGNQNSNGTPAAATSTTQPA